MLQATFEYSDHTEGSMKPYKGIGLVGVGIALFILGGCAMSSPANKQKLAEFNSTIPTCNGKADCKVKWQAAQLWVVQNSAYKIQTATDVVIETYNPSEAGTGLAAEVTKEPMGHGEYKIVVKLWCNNIFGCVPDALDSEIDFNKTVAAAKP